MIVECPKCKSTYNLPDEKVESGDMKVRCTECKEVFTAAAARVPEPEQTEPEAPEAPESGDAEPEAPDGLDALGEALGEDVAKPEQDAEAEAPGDEAGEEDAPEPEGDAEAAGDEGSEEEAAGDEAGDDAGVEDTGKAPSLDEGKGEALSFDIGGGAKEKKKLKIKVGKKLGIILAAAVVVLLLGGGAAWYFLSSGGAPATGLEALTEEDAEANEDVRNISLKNIRQYYVDNDKAGRIFVVEGRAVNDFETPKGFIKIQADLFDEEGRVLGTHAFLCGNSLSLYQLQVLGEEEIQSALADQAGIASSNVDLGPGMEVPFMVVFFNPPESVREFMVKVIEAKDPAPAKE